MVPAVHAKEAVMRKILLESAQILLGWVLHCLIVAVLLVVLVGWVLLHGAAFDIGGLLGGFGLIAFEVCIAAVCVAMVREADKTR